MPITCTDFVRSFRRSLGVTTDPPPTTRDVFHAGDPSRAITGVVVTFQATLGVLQSAIDKGANLVVTHEPTFYQDEPPASLAGDPVYESKRDFIERNGLVVWRCHDLPHNVRPDAILAGLVEQLGWSGYQQSDERVFDVPRTTLDGLAKEFKQRLALDGVQVVGDPSLPARRVAISVGCSGWGRHRELLRHPDVDVLVCGEVFEWQANEYVRDSRFTQRPQGLIVLGHCVSEEPGMRYVARQIAKAFPDLAIHVVPAGDPFRLV